MRRPAWTCSSWRNAAATEEPWPGYRVSSASYVVSLMPPQVVRELDLKRFGYGVSIITPDYFVPFPDGSFDLGLEDEVPQGSS